MNLTLINSLSALAGLIFAGTGLIVAVVGGFWLIKSGIGKTVASSQQDAINALQATIVALQADVTTLQRRIDNEEKRNTQLELTIDTIKAALKTRGLIITIDGEMVIIDTLDSKSSTVTRMQEKHNGEKP